MVKFRGIEINIISQLDICKLPEFKHNPSSEQIHNDPFRTTAKGKASSISPPPIYPTASCAVPIYPGSQVWLEYTIDGPHPPNAAYFFKLIVNDVTVTGWDCTSKHGYHGKMMYNLVAEGRQMFKRQALRFGDGLDNGELEDVVQVNVYRIGKRVRIRDVDEGVGKVEIMTRRADGLRLTNSGLVEPGIRPRRYKYQLLDPKDVPYAVFQFHCRSVELLQKQGLIASRDYESPISAKSSVMSKSSGNVQVFPNTNEAGREERKDTVSPLASPQQGKKTATMPHIGIVINQRSPESLDAEILKVSAGMNQLPLSDSDESLSVKTRDSVEEMPTNVTRSPRSPKSPKKEKDLEVPPSPTRSPRRRLTKKLAVNIDGTNFDVSRKLRPMSPFTSSGTLRRTTTATAAITEIGPSVEEDAAANLPDSQPVVETRGLRTTAEERGGRRLMSLLGRRITGQKGTISGKGDGQDLEGASKCMPDRENK